MKSETANNRPWYKEPMVWLIIAIPSITVCWGGVMLSLALNTNDSLVSDSYYKDGVSYTENVKMDDYASRLQLHSTLVLTNQEARLTLDGYLDEQPSILTLKLIHPTLEDRDVDIVLQRVDDGLYTGAAELELPSRRYIWLQSPDQGWRIRATEVLEENRVVQLNAK
ncbi:FixH family protein [Oceanobacter mangrovi]|uniref:FixH family protein n=1 Tax=Oceanobacter mangrovi TaxID=2862510 RepID=UPI001C8F0FCF|nr:FixH family protein [Oceanobacter mangrovi]